MTATTLPTPYKTIDREIKLNPSNTPNLFKDLEFIQEVIQKAETKHKAAAAPLIAC